MKDPKLYVEAGASDFERRWLSAARAEEPPAEVVSRIERALGLGAGAAPVVPATAEAANAPQAAGVAKGGLSALRIAGLSALGVGGAVGLVLLLSRPAPPTSAPERTPAPESAEAPNAATIAPPTAPEPGADRGPAPPTGMLRDEIALIDGARAALAAGSPAQALALLERYRTRHPRGMLLPEALALRIEAMHRSGEHARARELARAYLAEYPRSPLARRVAQLAGGERRSAVRK
jgi:hypothetical protein